MGTTTFNSNNNLT